jgi:hypothetical protein
VATLITLALTAGFGLGAPAAPAQAPLPEDNAGTGQYVEPVPDAGGDRPSRPGGGNSNPGSSLPPSTRRALPGGEEGRALEGIAGDPGAGAPAGGGEAGGEDGEDGDGGGSSGSGGDDKTDKAAVAGTDETAASAIVGALAGEDGSTVPVLALGLGGLTLAAAAVAIRRRRPDGEDG